MFDNYDWFKTKVLQLTKIDLNSYKERQMKRRIDAIITKNNISTYEDYIVVLKTNTLLYKEFVNYLTINVSEFYRNPNQWELLEKEIIPYLFLEYGKKIKIWSAACSTGDEPYSLVMLLAKYIPYNQISIIATDIDDQVLSKAASGLYNVKSLKNLPKEFIDKYFVKMSDEVYQISDSVKSCVTFKKHNLLLDSYPQNCNMIVCRNVLIYFTEEAKNEIYQKFSTVQPENGILFVGSTEQILQPKNFGYEAFRSFFYRRKK